jgi:hypothetical protein
MSRVTARLVTAGSCLLLAGLVTTLFVLAALQLGKYSQIDIYIGAAWVFTLSLIISSPILVPLIRKKLKGE